MKFIYFYLIINLVSCSTSPTGRKQLTLMPDSQMNDMGATSFEELKKKVPIEHDPKINEYVKCIANAIAKVATDKTGVKSWEVKVFKDDSANAFALPGGKIGVHTGILKVAVNKHQLAAVLGHEVGHVIARHGNERVSQGLGTNVGMLIVSEAFKNKEQKGLILAGLAVGAQFGILLPYSRTHESEADLIGLDLMSKAGFDPRESVELWHNMGKASGGKEPPEFMSTHPSHSTRISNLSKNVGKYLPIYEDRKSLEKCQQI